jgi:hypothetical protein
MAPVWLEAGLSVPLDIGIAAEILRGCLPGFHGAMTTSPRFARQPQRGRRGSSKRMSSVIILRVRMVLLPFCQCLRGLSRIFTWRLMPIARCIFSFQWVGRDRWARRKTFAAGPAVPPYHCDIVVVQKLRAIGITAEGREARHWRGRWQQAGFPLPVVQEVVRRVCRWCADWCRG